MMRRRSLALLALVVLLAGCIPPEATPSASPAESSGTPVPSTPTPLASSALTTLDMTAALLAKTLPFYQHFRNQKPDDRRHRFDREAYRRRSVVEQCVGWLKECRAVGTRFDKLAVNYEATVKLAMIQRYLRKLTAVTDSPDRA